MAISAVSQSNPVNEMERYALMQQQRTVAEKAKAVSIPPPGDQPTIPTTPTKPATPTAAPTAVPAARTVAPAAASSGYDGESQAIDRQRTATPPFIHPRTQKSQTAGPNSLNVLAWGVPPSAKVNRPALPAGADTVQAAGSSAPAATAAGPRHGPRDDPKFRFKQEAVSTIHGSDSHPLRGLLAQDSNGQPRPAFLKPPSRHHYNLLGRSETLGEPLTPAARDGRPFYVEAGHGTSRFSGEPEFLGLQDAHGNQLQGKHEAKGVIITRRFVDIGGVPVERQTALQWEREIDPQTGKALLEPGTTERSPSSRGWPVSPGLDDAARPAASPALRGVSIAGRILTPVAVVSDGLRLKEAYDADGGKVGEQTVKTAGSVAGGWAGAAAGAQVGGEVGAAVGVWFGGVGAAPGAIIGGVVGGVVGGLGGSWLGEALA